MSAAEAARRLDAAKAAESEAAIAIAAALVDTGQVPLGYRAAYTRARRDVWFARTAYLHKKRSAHALQRVTA